MATSGMFSGLSTSSRPSDDFLNPWGVLSDKGDRQGAADAAQDQRNLGGQQYGDLQKINQTQSGADWRYTNEQDRLARDSRSRVEEARNPYIQRLGQQQQQIGRDTAQSTGQWGAGNSIYSGLMNKGAADNKSAMSLSQAMDPNNAVAQSNRNLQTSRTTDLGNQARTATAARPMTGSPAGVNPALLKSVNQSRSGQAYAVAQNRMNDMRNQNFMYGLNASNNAYGLGQNALQNSQGIANQYSQQQGAYGQEQGGLRNENMNVSGARLGEQTGQVMGRAQDRLDYLGNYQQSSTNQGNRTLANMGQRYGVDTSSYTGQAQAAAGGAGGMISGIGSAVGAAAGAGSKGGNPPQQGVPEQRGGGGYVPGYTNTNAGGGMR